MAGYRVGLTGGIGSGKSAAAELLRGHGARIIDADAIAYELTSPGGAAIAAIRARFGVSSIDTDGALDRARMRALAFSDDSARRALEAILHPLIRTTMMAREVAASDAPYTVLVVPLLVESEHWRERVDRVLVVDLPVEQQIERVCRTRGLAAVEVRRIVDRQASRTARLALADDVVCNDGTRADLAVRAARLHAAYAGVARCM